ncbi:hypothetical protein ACFL96_08235 [Thermoproteota archaeon]
MYMARSGICCLMVMKGFGEVRAPRTKGGKMRKGKLIGAITIILIISALFFIYVNLGKTSFPQITPNTKNAAEEILDYAFLSLMGHIQDAGPKLQKYSDGDKDFVMFSLRDLRGAYEKIGNEEKVAIAGKLKSDLYDGHIMDSYEPYWSFGDWQPIDDLLKNNEIDKAIVKAKGSQTCLAEIARHVMQNKDYDKVLDMLDKNINDFYYRTRTFTELALAFYESGQDLSNSQRKMLQKILNSSGK